MSTLPALSTRPKLPLRQLPNLNDDSIHSYSHISATINSIEHPRSLVPPRPLYKGRVLRTNGTIPLAKVIKGYDTFGDAQEVLKPGDIVQVISKKQGDYCKCKCNGIIGRVPVTHLKFLDEVRDESFSDEEAMRKRAKKSVESESVDQVLDPSVKGKKSKRRHRRSRKEKEESGESTESEDRHHRHRRHHRRRRHRSRKMNETNAADEEIESSRRHRRHRSRQESSSSDSNFSKKHSAPANDTAQSVEHITRDDREDVLVTHYEKLSMTETKEDTQTLSKESDLIATIDSASKHDERRLENAAAKNGTGIFGKQFGDKVRSLLGRKNVRARSDTSGILNACVGTVQGEEGWYEHGEHERYYFILSDNKWHLLYGPMTDSDFKTYSAMVTEENQYIELPPTYLHEAGYYLCPSNRVRKLNY